ncbi:hypothetical protein VTJ83DRAFT_276 [Remersonia thermophila]|uniref:Uncharacterized protein n=1 Tax=Remersonia thermophila TaxID=72144 RepID=A0ABR4DKJ7_9PEZI
MAANDPSTPIGRKGYETTARRTGLSGPSTPWARKSGSEASMTRKNAAAPAFQVTPTPSRTRNAFSSPFTPTPGYIGDGIDDDEEITISVLGLLQGELLAPQKREALRTMLNNHARRARGVEQGRNHLRGEVRQLRARVAELEEEQHALRQAAAKAAGQLLTLSQGRGTGAGTGAGTGTGTATMIKAQAEAEVEDEYDWEFDDDESVN